MDGDKTEADDALREVVIGAAFAVANGLGHGFLESVYRKAMVIELRHRAIPVVQEVSFPVVYRGEAVGAFKADLIVADRLILELKVCDALNNAHVGQTLNYLAATGLKSALLINFGKPKIEIRRLTR